MKRLLVLSDTHTFDPDELPPAVFAEAEGCDLIVHCGDVGSDEVLDALREAGEVLCVQGNTDRGVPGLDELPDHAVVEVEGVRIGAVHGWGALEDPTELLPVFHPTPVDVVLFGHTHRRLARTEGGVFFLNPGAIRNSRDDRPSFAVLEVDGGNYRHKFVIL